MHKTFILIVIVTFFSCDKKFVQKPAEKKEDTFLQESVKREKKRQQLEYEQLEAWVAQNPQFQFTKTPYGYWMESYSSSPNGEPMKDLTYVQYIKQYKDLDKKVLYSFEDQGIQNIILGKTEEIRGIETAIRQMKEGQKATLLLPSFMAYGLYGDENKIGAHEPIIVELQLLKVNKNLVEE